MHSEQLNELAKALVSAQKDFTAIPKTQTAKVAMKNGGQYSYSYADLADIWVSIRPVLAKNGLAITQFIESEESSDKLRTTIWHESGQYIDGAMKLPLQGKTPQEAGSVITYYKRYALGAALGIATEEDDDGHAGNKVPAKSAPISNGPTDKQLDMVSDLMRKLGYESTKIREGVASLATSKAASDAIKKLQERVNGAESA